MNSLCKVTPELARSLARAFAVCVFAFAAAQIPAQQSPPPPPQTTPAQPPSDPQQPGQAEQVHTGTNSGLDADQRLQNLLADHQFLRLEAQLPQLPPDQAQFYRGLLANRSNDLKKSIDLLEPLIDKVAASGNVAHEKLLRKALAEDYLREGDWAKAAKAYETLETRLQSKLTPDEQDELDMPVKMLPLAAANPPMTVEPCDPFLLQVSKDPLGLTDLPVYVDARPHSWMLDPTAPFNLIARSEAKEAGLKVSEQSATIHTLTGHPIVVHVAIIPRFTIGGRLTLRNMTAFVFEDKDYYFPKTRYQVEGVLGYAALSALGSVTITSDDTIDVRPAKEIQPTEKEEQLKSGARFFLDGDQIIVALGKVPTPGDPPSPEASAAGDERMYVIDAGGQQTYLTSRYYNEHTSDFDNQKMALFTLPGPLALPPVPAYVAETVPLTAGSTTDHIHYIEVLTQPLGAAALDDVYGVLGVDALDQLKSYTFDYRTMRFTMKAE